jgi:hypothetical protein
MAPACFSKTMPSSGSDYVPFWATSTCQYVGSTIHSIIASYHNNVEVAQKWTLSLPDDGSVLMKHLGAIVRNKKIKEVYRSVHLFVSLRTQNLYVQKISTYTKSTINSHMLTLRNKSGMYLNTGGFWDVTPRLAQGWMVVFPETLNPSRTKLYLI